MLRSPSALLPRSISWAGVIPLSASQTIYLTVDLSPGRYTWISHVSTKKGMMKTFSVE